MSTSLNQHLSENPVIAEIPTSSHHQHRQELLSERSNGPLPVSVSTVSATRTYPSAAAKYEDVAQSSELFWEKLKGFHESFETKFAVPTVGGKSLDLHRLFVEVTSRGGLEKVIRDRRWKELIGVFNFPTTITSASFVLRKYYISLLYHFEQVYYFQKLNIAMSPPAQDAASKTRENRSRKVKKDRIMAELQDCSDLQIGSTVTGTIDGKFDDGYLITVNIGSKQFKGVLYHAPVTASENNMALSTTRRGRKRSRLESRDPDRPKSNRSGYNFFFAEHYARLKPLYHGKERAISKKIGVLWNNLTEAEKKIYQEKGLKDKERYRTEMLEYKSSNAPAPKQRNVTAQEGDK